MFYVKQLLSDDNSIYFENLKDSLENDNTIFIYRKSYSGVNAELIQFIIDDIVNYCSYDVEFYYKNNLAAYLCDYCRKYHKITLKNAIALAKLLKSDASENDIIKATLQALFNKRYEVTFIRGCCQDDWAKCFYAIDEINSKYLEYIEQVYFNIGVEIMIHDEKNTPSNADEISGYSDYIAQTSATLIDDVAEYLNTSKENIVLYEIEKTVQVTKVIYKEVR